MKHDLMMRIAFIGWVFKLSLTDPLHTHYLMHDGKHWVVSRTPFPSEIDRMKEDVRFALGVPLTTETDSWPHLVNEIMVNRVIAEAKEDPSGR